jgi:hypothetical protein
MLCGLLGIDQVAAQELFGFRISLVRGAPMQTWEYTVLILEMWEESRAEDRQLAGREDILTELGSAGWELVTVVPLTLGSSRGSETTHERWVFKRPANANGVATATAEATIEHDPQPGELRGARPLTGMKEIVSPKRDADDC